MRPEDERLGAGATVVYGLQHVLTMYGGIVAVPLIVRSGRRSFAGRDRAF